MIFLPLMGYSPSIITTNTVQIVWVNTSIDTWLDRSYAYETITDTFDWYKRYTGVELHYVESTLYIDEDINALDACKDWSWTPEQIQGPTLYMIAWEPTYRMLKCENDDVGDATLMHRSIVRGGVSPPELVHIISHLYGALFHTQNEDILDITPTGDQDRYTYVKAYNQGIISDRTKLAIGLN